MQELVSIYKKFVLVNRRERLAGRDRKAELVQMCSKTLSTVVLLDSCLWVPKTKVNLHITHLMVKKNIKRISMCRDLVRLIRCRMRVTHLCLHVFCCVQGWETAGSDDKYLITGCFTLIS